MESVRARLIPSIERLRQSPRAQALEAAYGRDALVSALRAEAAALRAQWSTSATPLDSAAPAPLDRATPAQRERATPSPLVSAAKQPDNAPGAPATSDDESSDSVAARLLDRAETRLAQTLRSRLEPVINATGVIIHTNLGRAPLCQSALDRMNAIGRAYTSLEYDLDRGSRGRRDVHAEPLLCHLTGAEAAIVVNNNAAAVLLMLSALASGREVIISRGELVEIGGGFRVPDVMRQSGAVLREVGTTNRTRIADYAAAISDRTALMLRVHPSNFVIQGFTARPSLEELSALSRQLSIPVVEDLGSGYLEISNDSNDDDESSRAKAATTNQPGSSSQGKPATIHEPSVQASLSAGIDVVTFSADKLLGGPQAGIIVGRRDLIDAMRRHPLMRALRVDKLTYAAIEATLLEYARGRATSTVPVRRMLALDAATLMARATALAARLRAANIRASVTAGESAIGGGSAPGLRLPTSLLTIEIEDLSPDALLARLRSTTPPVIARIDSGRVVFDLRTVLPEDDETLAATLLRLV